MIIDNRYYRIKSIFGYRLRALEYTDADVDENLIHIIHIMFFASLFEKGPA